MDTDWIGPGWALLRRLQGWSTIQTHMDYHDATRLLRANGIHWSWMSRRWDDEWGWIFSVSDGNRAQEILSPPPAPQRKHWWG